MTDAARKPRRWIAAIGGWSPNTGVISLNPKAYDRYPPSTERVWVQEVLADQAEPAPAEEAAPAVAAQAEPAPAAEPAHAVDVDAAIEAAFTDLARELGCFHSTDIPSNAGLFVPGQPKAQPNARAALVALFAHVREGGLVHRPLTADTLKALGLVKAPTPAAAPELVRTTKEAAPAQAEPAAEQIGLF